MSGAVRGGGDMSGESVSELICPVEKLVGNCAGAIGLQSPYVQRLRYTDTHTHSF